MMFKCLLCKRDFDNEENYHRHLESGAHLRLVKARGVGGTGGTGGTHPTPSTSLATISKPGELVPLKPLGELVPLKPPGELGWLGIPKTTWKWVGMGSVAVVVLVIADRAYAGRGKARAPEVLKLPGLGDLSKVIPLGLSGLVGYLIISKLLRTEISSWIKIIHDWGKS